MARLLLLHSGKPKTLACEIANNRKDRKGKKRKKVKALHVRARGPVPQVKFTDKVRPASFIAKGSLAFPPFAFLLGCRTGSRVSLCWGRGWAQRPQRGRLEKAEQGEGEASMAPAEEQQWQVWLRRAGAPAKTSHCEGWGSPTFPRLAVGTPLSRPC